MGVDGGFLLPLLMFVAFDLISRLSNNTSLPLVLTFCFCLRPSWTGILSLAILMSLTTTFFHNFRLNGRVCAYININTPVTRLVNLESPNFDVLWVKIFFPTTTIILCFCYFSPNGTDFPVFFNILLLLTRLSLVLIQMLKSSI